MIATDLPIATARAAQHCAQLMSRAAEPLDLRKEAGRLAAMFAEQLAPRFARHCSLRGLEIAVGETVRTSFAGLCETTGDSAYSTMFALGAERSGIFAVVPACQLVALFDRLLGGDGVVDPNSTTLPRSAMTFASGFEQAMLAAIREASERDAFDLAGSQPSGHLSGIAPLDAGEELWSVELIVTAPSTQRWTLTLGLCDATLALITASRAASPATGRAIGARSVASSPVGEVALPLRAVLVDTDIPLARLTSLTPGTLLPVALNRSIPLLIERAVIAEGTPGEIDDRVALEISQTHIFGTN